MKPNLVFISMVLLASILLNACGPITVSAPGVELTVVVGAEPPAGNEPAQPSDGGAPQPSNEAMMMFLYIILALVGIAIMFAFIATLRRPDAP